MPNRKRRIKQAAIITRFAERLRQVRTAHGMTQKDLADKAQVTLSYVSKLEAGDSAPGLDLLDRLASALGVSIPDLLPRADPVSKDRTALVKGRVDSLLGRAGDETLSMLTLWLDRLEVSPLLGR